MGEEEIFISSDIAQRDGIGIKVFKDKVLILEIFRDDTLKSRTIDLYKNDISLDDMERYIDVFKKEIPWDFIG